MIESGDGVAVEFADLGDWAPLRAVAEYDAFARTIRIDREAFDAVRAALGEALARAFVAHAVAHERYHARHPGCGESAAREAGLRASGVPAETFEAVLRRR